MTMRTLLAGVAFGFLLVPSAWAGWIPEGTRVPGSATSPGNFSAASDGAGGVFVCWVDYRDGPPHVFAQRMTAAGDIAPGWPADGLRVCPTVGFALQESPLVTADGTGGAIFAWSDSRSAVAGEGPPGVYVLRVTGDGVVAPGWPALGVAIVPGSACYATTLAPPILAGSDGGAIVFVHSSPAPGAPHGCPREFSHVTAQHVTGDGIPDWSSTFSEYGAISGPAVAADVAGGVILTLWSRVSIPPYAVRITAGGQTVPGWPSSVTSEPVGGAFPASDGAGGAFFALAQWNPTTRLYEVYMQHLLADGSRAPGYPEVGLQAVTGSGDQRPWAIISDGEGGAIVGWSRSVGESSSDLHAQRLTAIGEPAQGWGADGVPICIAPGGQGGVALVPDGHGGAWFAWFDLRSGSSELFALRISAQGTLMPGWLPDGTRINSTPYTYPFPVVVPSTDESAIVVWLDRRELPLAIYAQRLVGDGPVPVAMDLVSVAPASGFVKITGMITDGAGLLVTVYRRSDGGEPVSIATVFPDGTGRIEHVDRDVEPGARYGYQLSARAGDREILTREVQVEIPAAPRFAIEPIHPNPSTGALTVAFTLPTPDQASLELLDLAGRRLAVRQVESLGTGRRTVGFPEARSFAPGLYHARLTQGARSLSVKFCVTR